MSHILVIGSWPIIVGQGLRVRLQARRVLCADGLRVI